MSKMLIIGALVLLFSCLPTLGQGPGDISLVRVALDEPTPKKQLLGADITFRVKAPVPLPTSFHVRIFRGTLNLVTQGMKSLADEQGCITYPTALLYGVADTAIHFGALSDLAWLSKGPDGRFAAEDLVLVFEAGDQPTNTRVRLHKSQLDAYFKYAVPMQLLPSAEAKAAPIQVVEATQRALEEHRVELTQLPSVPCYNVEQLAAAPNEQQVISNVAVVRPTSCGIVGQRTPWRITLDHISIPL